MIIIIIIIIIMIDYDDVIMFWSLRKPIVHSCAVIISVATNNRTGTCLQSNLGQNNRRAGHQKKFGSVYYFPDPIEATL